MNKIIILHLYPDEMNTYGDRGNVLVLKRRAKLHGLDAEVIYHHPGDKLPAKVDLVFGGGGQDAAQVDIQRDILAIGPRLKEWADHGTPMLMICGMYQLFGKRFITNKNEEIKGIGIFDMETRAGTHRLIGNVAVDTGRFGFGVLYGFENHSGQTVLSASQEPLGKVLRGKGNSDKSKQEGAVTNNVIGCYLHGPVLPLNPMLADWLIYTSAKRNDPNFKPKRLDDRLVAIARLAAQRRTY